MKPSSTIRLLLAAALLLLAPAARSEIVVRHVTGSGTSRDNAVSAGLVEAVRQVSGTMLQSASSSALASAEIMETSSGPGGSSSSASAAVQTYDEKTDTVTKGVVAGYTVLSEQHDPAAGIWNVSMEVSVALYKTPGLSPDSRRKIAILPFRTPGDFRVGGAMLSAETVSRDMADRLIALFTQSRRFAVLSRQDDDVLRAEKELIIREAPVTEMAKIGQTLGADYLLAGTVADLAISEPTQRESPVSGTVMTLLYYARMKVQYRIVVVGTSQIKFADDIYIELDRDQLRAARADPAAAYEMLKREAAHRIAWRALSAIYPAHVVDLLDNGEIVFDEGGSLVGMGTYYDVFRLGAQVRSRSSGESLGRTEEKVATALVTRVDPKMSYARPVSGAVDWEDFDQGLIIRPYRPEPVPVPVSMPVAAPSGAYAAPAPPSPGGVTLPATPDTGVRLPFD